MMNMNLPNTAFVAIYQDPQGKYVVYGFSSQKEMQEKNEVMTTRLRYRSVATFLHPENDFFKKATQFCENLGPKKTIADITLEKINDAYQEK